MHRDQSLSARDNLECCPLASLKKKRGAPLDPGVALPFSNGALPFEHWSGRGSSRPGWWCTHSPEEEEDVEEEDVDDLGQRDTTKGDDAQSRSDKGLAIELHGWPPWPCKMDSRAHLNMPSP